MNLSLSQFPILRRVSSDPEIHVSVPVYLLLQIRCCLPPARLHRSAAVWRHWPDRPPHRFQSGNRHHARDVFLTSSFIAFVGMLNEFLSAKPRIHTHQHTRSISIANASIVLTGVARMMATPAFDAFIPECSEPIDARWGVASAVNTD